MALVIFSFCFLVHRFPVPNVSLCQDSFVLLATVLHLVEARIPYSTTPSPEGQPWHLRIISDGCDSKGLHSANRKHQRERSLKFHWSVQHARQALWWEWKLQGPPASHSVSDLSVSPPGWWPQCCQHNRCSFILSSIINNFKKCFQDVKR